ncbi:MAG: pyruvate kinase [Alphaproteobacteria bacterium]|nr:pyruvate kinase [Alphaproteobacteria bacterium]
MRRFRQAKIVATLGPASTTPEAIESLFMAGADVFRLNFSHGTHPEHRQSVDHIRNLEKKLGRPIAIVADLQGPKLRVSTFETGKITLKPHQHFTLDLDPTPGNNDRVCLPHPELFPALTKGADLLLDDGKLALRVIENGKTSVMTEVITGGELSNRKGLNVPGVMLPISALTTKDRADLEFSLSLGVDWIALSFVQKPEDVIEAKGLIKDRAKLISKLEKPMAIVHLTEIVQLSDAIMVARGDLGVEMLPEEVPCIQKEIIKACRSAGKPVIVATQMLDSMVSCPSPTRAEASDVATAIYDGVDAVMLSAESASGQYPVEAVAMMNRIITKVEHDPIYRQMLEDSRPKAMDTVAGAITAAARQAAHIIRVSVTVTFSETGSTTLRAARERPESPILALTPNVGTARFLALVWGVHAIPTEEVYSFAHMVETACKSAHNAGFAEVNDKIIVIAGVPFGTSGGTNILRIATIEAP